jgi:hypothetical protein
MDDFLEQVRLLKEQGNWINQQCIIWINKTLNEFALKGKVSDETIKQSKELLGRSEQWCKDVKKRGFITGDECEEWKQ